jgi:hypothetical protein
MAMPIPGHPTTVAVVVIGFGRPEFADDASFWSQKVWKKLKFD